MPTIVFCSTKGGVGKSTFGCTLYQLDKGDVSNDKSAIENAEL
ncbi:ParA family protein [Bartonella sp. MM73XJBT.G]|nr:hypothetical protein [Bartonella sp. MM73XJBT.G]